MPVARFVASQPQPMRDLLETVRSFLHETAPGLREAVKWGVPTFMTDRNLFYLNPKPSDGKQPPAVVLGFCEGAHMMEFKGVFDEVKAEVAHVIVRSASDLERDGLREAVRAAVGLPRLGKKAGALLA